DRRECQRGMEVAFRRRALPYPGRGNTAVALDRARHRKTGRLRKLGGEITADGEEIQALRTIHDRKLAALQLVSLVRVNLVDHLDQRVAPRDQTALLAVGREDHVVACQGMRRGYAGGLLARALHVEAGLALPLASVHPFVESADQRHVAQYLPQSVRR